MKAGGLKAYLGALAATILFPVLWMRALRLARRHTDADPRGPVKVAAAIAVGVGILLVGAFVLIGFQDRAIEGMYESMDTRLQAAVGEKDYQDNVATVEAAETALPVIVANLEKAERAFANATEMNQTDPSAANAKRARDAEGNYSKLGQAYSDTVNQRNVALDNVGKFTPNHELYQRLQPMIADQDDDAIRAEVADAGLAQPADAVGGTEAAIAVKDQSVRDMYWSMWLFVWPSLFGAFFAPLAFALGSILKRAFAESDTVGFKPYPGAAAGWFLLFGAFGLPSLPFAAWVFMDAENRSVEGQIAL